MACYMWLVPIAKREENSSDDVAMIGVGWIKCKQPDPCKVRAEMIFQVTVSAVRPA
jgi:hypothetical protein